MIDTAPSLDDLQAAAHSVMDLALLRRRFDREGPEASCRLAREYRDLEGQLAAVDAPLAEEVAAWRAAYAGFRHLLARDDRWLGRGLRLAQHALSAHPGSPLARAAAVWLERARPAEAMLVRRRDEGRDLLLSAIDTGHAISAVAAHPDGRRLFSAGADEQIAVWDGETGERLATLVGHGAAIRALLTCPPFLASSAADGTLTLWDLDRLAKVAEVTAHLGAANAITPMRKAGMIATAGEDGAARVWQLPTLARLGEIGGAKACLRAVTTYPGGWLVAGGGVAAKAVWWVGRPDGRPLLHITGPRAAVTGLVSFSWNHVVASSEDGALHLWTGPNQGTRAFPVGHGDHLLATTELAGTCRALAACRDGLVYGSFLSEAPVGYEVGRHSGPVAAVAMRPGSDVAITGGQDGMIACWSAQMSIVQRGHAGTVKALATGPSLLCSGGADGVVMCWNSTSSRPLEQTAPVDSAVTALCAGPGVVFAGHERGDLRACQFTGTGRPRVEPLGRHGGAVSALAYEPKARVLWSAGWDGVVRSWQQGPDAPVHFTSAGTLPGHRGCVLALAADGQRDLLLSGGWTREILIHSLSRRKLVGHLSGHRSPVVALATCGAMLVSADDDGGIGFANLDRGGDVTVKPAHAKAVTALAATSTYAVSGGEDGRVLIWQPSEGQRLHEVEAARGAIRGLAPSPDGRFCAVAADDGSLRVLTLSSGEVTAGWLLGSGATTCGWADGAIACGTRSGEVQLFDFLPPRLITAASWHDERPILAALDSEGILSVGEWHAAALYLEPLATRQLFAREAASGVETQAIAWSVCGQALRIVHGDGALVLAATTLAAAPEPASGWRGPAATSPDGCWQVVPGTAGVRPTAGRPANYGR
jgi:WD40 repeat protein